MLRVSIAFLATLTLAACMLSIRAKHDHDFRAGIGRSPVEKEIRELRKEIAELRKLVERHECAK